MVFILVTAGWKWRLLVSSKHIWLQLARCLCVLIAQYGIAFYLTKNTLLNATVLLNSSPLFIPLIEWLFLKQIPGKSTIFGALLAFLGVILVLHPDKSLFTPMSGIGILAALGQSGSQVLYGLKSKSENLLSSLFYLFFFTSLVSFLIFILQGFDMETLAMNPQNGTAAANWIIFLTVFLKNLQHYYMYLRKIAYEPQS